MLRSSILVVTLLLAPALARAQEAPPPEAALAEPGLEEPELEEPELADPSGRAVMLRIGAGASALPGPDRAGLTGELGVQIPLAEWMSIDVVARLGVDPWDQQGRIWIALLAGVRGELPLDAWRPYLALRIAHVHDAPLDAWGEHFGETLAGDPSHGLGHLTALGGALGATWEVPGTQRRVVLSAEAEGLGLIHGHMHAGAPAGWIGGVIGVGWQFF